MAPIAGRIEVLQVRTKRVGAWGVQWACDGVGVLVAEAWDANHRRVESAFMRSYRTQFSGPKGTRLFGKRSLIFFVSVQIPDFQVLMDSEKLLPKYGTPSKSHKSGVGLGVQWACDGGGACIWTSASTPPHWVRP